jgi:PqqD family protein of HPr-rel-A system
VSEFTHDKWVVPEWVRLQWRRWDDEYVVFNTASGHTHVLNGLAAKTLKQLQESPSSTTDVLLRISESTQGEKSSKLIEQLDRLFAEFDEVGLTERVQR